MSLDEFLTLLWKKYCYQDGITVDSDGRGPRLHIPFDEEMIEFLKLVKGESEEV